jgi:hypothetical protein
MWLPLAAASRRGSSADAAARAGRLRKTAPRRGPAPERRNAQARRRHLAQGHEPTGAIRQPAPRYDRCAYREWILECRARSAEATGKHGNSHSPAGRSHKPGNDQAAKVTDSEEREFAQVAHLTAAERLLKSALLPAARASGTYRSEHTYGGSAGRRCCTLLLYYPVRFVRIMLLTR